MKSPHMRNNRSFLAAALFFTLLAALIGTVSAHVVSPDTFVRVVSGNPETRTYTFSCRVDPENDFLRDWFIRPDDGNTADDPNEAAILDKKSNESMTYTFKENTFYHIGCYIWNPFGAGNPANDFRGDIHMDLRNANNWNPQIVPLSGNGLTATYECRYSGADYTASWDVINAQAHTRSSIGNGKTITHTVSGHGLYDYICNIVDTNGVRKSTGLPVEYFDQGAPYFPDKSGVPDGIKNVWNRAGATPPACTPTAETCNAKDDDCDGLVDENNVCGASPNCFSNVQTIPSTCDGTISSDSMQGGCRVINCNNGADSMQIKACDKPDGMTPQFFEMYRQSFIGNPLKICIGSSCMKNEGYIKSQLYPICTGSAQPPPACTPTAETCNAKDDDCDGLIDENNVCSAPANTTQCFSTLQSAPAKCNGGTISEDTFSGCRAVSCGVGTSSLKILACDKPDGSNPQFFEMYKQNEAGTAQLEICLGSTCIKDNGFAKSGAYPICTENAGTGINSPPNAPTWLEPSVTIPIDTFDFHIQIFPMQDAESDSHVASDFEMYDAIINERVWSRLHQGSPLIHVHNFDGNFEGNLANNNRSLKFDHDYKLRARFYENANGTEQASQWSDWRNFHTKSQANGTTTTSSSLVNTSLGWAVRSGYGLQLVAAGVSVPVNVVIAPELYSHLPEGQQPLVYFTQLYGQVGMIRKDGTYAQYAGNLLNYQSFGSLPGSGETGVDGIYADTATGDLFVSMVYHDNASSSGYFGKVMRFFTNANGDGFTSTQTILSGIPVSPSHHVHQITRGPDGKLYMSVGDADDPFNAKNTNVLSAKILRFNDDGSNPGDNPFGSLVWAAGFRNAFGTAWRPGTNELFATNNGPDSDDGVYKVTRGSIFGWCCSTSLGTWHLWPTTTAPVQAAFDAGASGYPSDSMGSLYVALSGSTYSKGPDPISKRIVQFTLNPDGTKKSVSDIAVYTGSGFSAPIGLAFGPDGLYFTDIYGQEGFTGVGQTKGNIYRIKFGASSSTAPPGSFSVAFGPGRWYPKGLEMVWECKQSNGVGPFKYDFVFGDGQKQFNMDSFSTYHKYIAEGTYASSCTVHDLANGKSASATTTITLKNCTSADFQCNTA